MDTTEGIHKPLGKYIFNWINFNNKDPLIGRLAAAGYRTLPNPGDPGATLVCFPEKFENIEFETVEKERKDGTIEVIEVNTESAIDQLNRYKKVQMYYCEQNVSNTISYSPEEVPDIVQWLLDNWEYYIGVSFLFRADPTLSAKDLGFEYLPQEVVTQERYEAYVKELRQIDWSDTESTEELIMDDCSTGACPIK